MAGFPDHGMAKNPYKVLIPSFSILVWSYPERGMGGRKVAAGGGLCAFKQPSLIVAGDLILLFFVLPL